MRLGWMEIIIILVVVLLLFGSKRLPELARSIGRSLQEFKRGMKDITDDIKKDDNKDGKSS